MLAGDHCKAASDERLNFVAVGLLYRQGYFIQTVDSDGVQHADYADTDPRDLPVEPVLTPDGAWLKVTVRIAGREVYARVWRAQVGRVPVYLLDTNCTENSNSDRDITHRLYGGDEAARIRQEMVLGIGGVRALRALGLAPGVWHINEGHAAFLVLELLREGVARGLDFERRAGGGRGAVRVHDAHAGRRRPRRLPRRPVRLLLRRVRARAGRAARAAARELGARSGCQRRLQHDAAGAQRRAARERREPHPRRGVGPAGR